MFFSAAGPLAHPIIMGMEMGCALLQGVLQRHVPFQPLTQIAGLSDVDGNPTPVLGLSGINEIAGRCLKGSVQRVNRVGIVLS